MGMAAIIWILLSCQYGDGIQPYMSTTKESSISSITPLTSKNYHSWANYIKSWLQLNGLWHLVSGLERKPAGKAEVWDTAGNVVTPAVDVNEDKLE